MFNSRNLGALIVDERPHVREWDEPQFGIQNIGIEESYGFGVLNEGQAIAVAKRRRNLRERETAAGRRMVLSVGSDDAVFEVPNALVGVSLVDVGAERFRTLSGPSPPRRARLPSSEISCRPGPGSRARKPPLDAGFLASGAGPEPGC